MIDVLRGMALAASLLAMLLGASCTNFQTLECENDLYCPRGTVCSDLLGCADPAQIASCRGRAANEACSYPGVTSGLCVQGHCIPAGCGNGLQEEGEACDFGDTEPGNNCSADCQSDETCGNGIIDQTQGEACDDGNNIDDDGCQADCSSPFCGDGIRDTLFFESCDCGSDPGDLPEGCSGINSNLADASCRENCQPARCGDKVVDSGERCDDGNLEANDGCSPDCKSDESCGNSTVDFLLGEECDDGNLLNHDGCSSQCSRESPAWFRRIFGAVPEPRSQVAMAYDAAQGKVLLFAARDGAGGDLDDMWEWDGADWHQLNPPNFPSARTGHSLTYDENSGYVLFFGGGGNATWHWTGNNWQRDFPDNSPPPRSEHGAVYDAKRKTVLIFGGIETGDGPNAGQPLSDTWEWNGSDWTELSPATTPPARIAPALAFDPVIGGVLMYGGRNASAALSDTWVWNGSDWSQQSPAANAGPRSSHAMAYDLERSRSLLLGGFDSAGSPLGDTWEWNGSTWTQVATTGPSARGGANMVFDLVANVMVAFGGSSSTDGTSANDETWLWNGTAWSQATFSAQPPARSLHAQTYQLSSGRSLLFGGLAANLTTPLADTWEWNGRHWSERAPATSPDARLEHALVFDAARDEALLFGGANGANFGDTWTWDGSTWSEEAPASSPPARRRHALSYEASAARVLLFGGLDAAGQPLGDTWQWDGTTWLQLTPSTSPPARSGHTLSYDAIRQELVLFGGIDATGTTLDDTWLWTGTDWQLQSPDDQPVERFVGAMTYLAIRGSILLYGGRSTSNLLDDTWEWTGASALNPGSWIQHALGTRPGNLEMHTLSGDDARAAGLLFGGRLNGTATSATLSFQFDDGVRESCTLGFDGDGDGLVGCDDGDCWGFCRPQCPPGASCPVSAARCGDGVCNPGLENCRMCAADCGACVARCGDFLCEGAESAASCPGDC